MFVFFFQAEDGIRDYDVTGVQTCALPIFKTELNEQACTRAILIGHNASFDLGFLKAATDRTKIKSPFHQFSTLDTVTLSALYYGETVLAKAIVKAGIEWNELEAHSALYDTKKTAELFCKIFNQQKFCL